ncbi:unnamed protein product [Ascophyllum nodosum]
MARNKSKATAMLSNVKVGNAEQGDVLDLVVADICDRSSLTPSLFEVLWTVLSHQSPVRLVWHCRP